jgi:hypothetical protein
MAEFLYFSVRRVVVIRYVPPDLLEAWSSFLPMIDAFHLFAFIDTEASVTGWSPGGKII